MAEAYSPHTGHYRWKDVIYIDQQNYEHFYIYEVWVNWFGRMYPTESVINHALTDSFHSVSANEVWSYSSETLNILHSGDYYRVDYICNWKFGALIWWSHKYQHIVLNLYADGSYSVYNLYWVY